MDMGGPPSVKEYRKDAKEDGSVPVAAAIPRRRPTETEGGV